MSKEYVLTLTNRQMALIYAVIDFVDALERKRAIQYNQLYITGAPHREEIVALRNNICDAWKKQMHYKSKWGLSDYVRTHLNRVP